MRTNKNREDDGGNIFWVNNEDDADFPKNPDYCIKKKIELEKFDKSSLVKLKKILKISNHFRLDILRDILDIDEKNLIKIVKKWSADFDLEINGNYLRIKKETILEFIDALDKQFNEWEKTDMKNN